jgi:hypothetical protein
MLSLRVYQLVKVVAPKDDIIAGPDPIEKGKPQFFIHGHCLEKNLRFLSANHLNLALFFVYLLYEFKLYLNL